MADHREIRSQREIEALFAEGTCTGLSDGELLDRFQPRRDAASERASRRLSSTMDRWCCGPVQAILGDRQDAEDSVSGHVSRPAQSGVDPSSRVGDGLAPRRRL